jgi:hypothetical protein
MTGRFDEAMRLMRQHDPALMEDGFGLLRGHAGEHIEELIAEFGREENDHGLRCWLLELIGEARSERAFPLLAEQLYSSDESFRIWRSWVWSLSGLRQRARFFTRHDRMVRLPEADLPSQVMKAECLGRASTGRSGTPEVAYHG